MPKTGCIGGVSATLFVAVAAFRLKGWPDERTIAFATSLVAVVAAALAAVLAALATRRTSGIWRAAGLALTVGLIGATIAAILRAYDPSAAHTTAYVPPTGAAFLLFPVGVVTALLLFPRRHSHPSQGCVYLDGLIVAASLLIVWWLSAYSNESMSSPESVLSHAYLISVILALSVATAVLARAEDSRPLTFLTLGLTCVTLAELGYAQLSLSNRHFAGHVADLGWLAAMLLIAIGAAEGYRATSHFSGRTEKQAWVSILLPYVTLTLAGIVVAAQPRANPASGFVTLVGAVLVLAVLVRQFLLVAENRRLLAIKAEGARRDQLTGLGNRALFVDHLQQVLHRRRRDGLATGVVKLDLCDFKLINDTLGHTFGDALLISSADRLSGCVRPGSTVARLGSDRFAVLVDGGVDECEAVVRRALEAFDRPFKVDGHELLLRLSVGIAVADANEPDVVAVELLKRADMAVNSAKLARSGEVRVFSADTTAGSPDEDVLPQSTTTGGRAGIPKLLGELRRAIERTELTLAYQPKFDAHTRAVVGVEALLRWPHPDRGLVSPEEFLPLVRRQGLMGGVTDLVVNRALDDAKRWHAAGLDVPVAVNLFAPLLGNLNLPGKIVRALTKRGLDASALTVEITEDLFVEDMESTQRVLNELSEHGIKIAIDDFGTGYSALSYLTDLPVDEVKLDRGFVARIFADERAATVGYVVTDLAHRLNMVTAAEGVENAAMALRLRELGCDILQGNYLSPPLPVDELLVLLLNSKTALCQPF